MEILYAYSASYVLLPRFVRSRRRPELMTYLSFLQEVEIKLVDS
jgi:hypothetical protein